MRSSFWGLLLISLMSAGAGLYSIVTQKFHLKGNITVDGWVAVGFGLFFFLSGCIGFIAAFDMKRQLSKKSRK